MIFNSMAFIVFFAIVYTIYLAVRSHLFRHGLLLVASSVFYGWWDWRYLGLLWFVIFIAYGAGRVIDARPQIKKLVVTLTVTVLMILLSIFKYNNFFLQSLTGLAHTLGLSVGFSRVQILLPIGISFYVFHAISYMVDVYRSVIPAQRSLINVALYISYFPQLVAGPIVRASDFIPQLNNNVKIDEYYVTTGLREFTMGLIYKTAFADNLSHFIDPIFSNLGTYDNLSLISASIAYYGQIYFDFAGYSLMAIGIARMMGYNFPDNFNHPYRATSITEFWRKWHISLSTWLRLYLYIPLGGNRYGKWKMYRNLFITMLLGGLWHGASWNFVLWGGLHGLALAIHKFFSPKDAVPTQRGRIFHIIPGWVFTQLFVLLCWVPFRLPHFSQTMEVFSAFACLRPDKGLMHAPINYWLLFLPLIIDNFAAGFMASFLQRTVAWIPKPLCGILICFLIGIIFAVALTLVSIGITPFIYFQF